MELERKASYLKLEGPRSLASRDTGPENKFPFLSGSEKKSLSLTISSTGLKNKHVFNTCMLINL